LFPGSAASRRAMAAPVPMGPESWRSSQSTMVVTNVYLGGARLQACADLAAHGQRPALVDRVGFTDAKLSTIMVLLNEEATSGAGGGGSRSFMEHLIDLLCLQLLRIHALDLAPSEVVARRGLAAWQVRRVTAYILDHLDGDIGLQELADCVGLSRFYFCHAFRLATGYTPHQWLTRQRIARARQLLASPELPVTAVALAVGYQTPSAFAASFRKVAGMTPTQFRRKL
jgi:AraC family transcriptional regulator